MTGRVGRRCTWPVAIEHYREIACDRPAIIRIYRGELGALNICARHMDEPDIYAEVKARHWRWRLILAERDPGLTP